MLAEHFAGICAKETVEAEAEALAMIAAAAEGSVRDGLSILDQAIAHAEFQGADLDADGRVTAAQVRDMLGLADKSARRDLFAALLAGDGKALLDRVARQFALGVEPIALMRSAMELCHGVTLAQISGSHAEARSAEEREAIEGWAQRLTAGQLHRLWQLLLKGHEEVRTAPDPLVAAQMALLRVMHAADMPDPEKLAKQLEDLAARPGPAAPAGAPDAPPPAQDSPPWEALVARVERSGQLALADTMRMQVRVIALADGKLVYVQPPGFNEDIATELRDGLLKATGARWQVERGEGEGAPTLYECGEAAKGAAEDAVRRAPLVEAAFAAFPGAEFVNEEEDAPYRRGSRNWSQRR
jgi:DNA polymerase-3 subunit gamma/tau